MTGPRSYGFLAEERLPYIVATHEANEGSPRRHVDHVDHVGVAIPAPTKLASFSKLPVLQSAPIVLPRLETEASPSPSASPSTPVFGSSSPTPTPTPTPTPASGVSPLPNSPQPKGYPCDSASCDTFHASRTYAISHMRSCQWYIASLNIDNIWQSLNEALRNKDWLTSLSLLQHSTGLSRLHLSAALLAASASASPRYVAELLLARGAEVEARDEQGRTPLMRAADGGTVGLVEVLLKAGASIEKKDVDGMTALHFAAANGSDDALQIGLLLLNAGADMEAGGQGEGRGVGGRV